MYRIIRQITSEQFRRIWSTLQSEQEKVNMFGRLWNKKAYLPLQVKFSTFVCFRNRIQTI